MALTMPLITNIIGLVSFTLFLLVSLLLLSAHKAGKKKVFLFMGIGFLIYSLTGMGGIFARLMDPALGVTTTLTIRTAKMFAYALIFYGLVWRSK